MCSKEVMLTKYPNSSALCALDKRNIHPHVVWILIKPQYMPTIKKNTIVDFQDFEIIY